MPFSKYFKTLGLSEHATQDEIRKKYRELVKIYHPDINPNPIATQFFIEIKEAYTFLTENVEKIEIWRLKNELQHQTKRKNNILSKEAKIKMAKKRFQQKKERIIQDEKKYYKDLIQSKKWLLFKISSFISLVLAITILADEFLPKRYENDKIIAYNKDAVDLINDENAIHSNFDKVLVKTQNKHTYFLSDKDLNYRGIYTYLPLIIIEETYIFHFPKQIYSFELNHCKTYAINFTFGQTSLWVSLVLFIPFLTFLYKRNNTLFIIMFHICLYIINGLVMYLLLSQGRFMHLITLGHY